MPPGKVPGGDGAGRVRRSRPPAPRPVPPRLAAGHSGCRLRFSAPISLRSARRCL